MDACANCVDPDPRERAEFPNFKTLTQDQVSLIIGKAVVRSCPLDPAPTSVVLQVLDVLLPVITCMINTGVNLVCSQRNEGSPRIIHVIEEVWSIHRVQKPSPSKQSPRRLQVIRKLSYDDQRQSVLELQSAYKKTKYWDSAFKSEERYLIEYVCEEGDLAGSLRSQRSFWYCTPRHLAGRGEWWVDLACLTRHLTSLHRTSPTVYSVLQLTEGCQIPFRSRKGCRKGPSLARFCSKYITANYSRLLVDTCQVCTHTPMQYAIVVVVSPNVQGHDAGSAKAMRDCIMDLRKWMIRDRHHVKWWYHWVFAPWYKVTASSGWHK